MTIDWNHFTPWTSMAGGLLLGLAAALFVLMRGRVLGISGILAGLLPPRAGDRGWRLAMLAGMASAPLLFFALTPTGLVEAPRIDASYGVVALAGLLVGVGTRYGAGCTSGHGVCGLSRLSLRSLVATAVFMGAGFATVAFVRHLI